MVVTLSKVYTLLRFLMTDPQQTALEWLPLHNNAIQPAPVCSAIVSYLKVSRSASERCYFKAKVTKHAEYIDTPTTQRMQRVVLYLEVRKWSPWTRSAYDKLPSLSLFITYR